MAIRQNTNDLFAMRKSVIARLMHNTNFHDAETRYRYCPKNIDSWCKYQRGISAGEKKILRSCKLASCNKERIRTNF